MRQSNNGRRTRGGRPSRRPGPLKSQTFDSNGPEVRIRGNAHQVLEKYQNLARDASSSGDRVLAESYYQYAEHYYRIIHESTDPDSPGSNRPHHRPGRYDEQPEERDETVRAEPVVAEAVVPAPAAPAAPAAPEEAPAAAAQPQPQPQPVNGEAASGEESEGLERALENAPQVAAAEEESEAPASKKPASEKPASEKKSTRGNGQRTTRTRTRYRRQPRDASEEEKSGSHRRQFPMPADGAEEPEAADASDKQKG